MAITHPTLHSPLQRRNKDVSLEMSFLMLRRNSSSIGSRAKFPKISKESIETALIFLEKQKIANFPCLVHTESRGYDWVVFRRQPDRTPTLYYDVEETESEDGDNEQDDDYFSVEPVDIDEEEEEDQTNCEMNPDVTGAASSTNENLPDGLDKHQKNLDLEILHQYTPGILIRIPRSKRPLMKRKK